MLEKTNTKETCSQIPLKYEIHPTPPGFNARSHFNGMQVVRNQSLMECKWFEIRVFLQHDCFP